MLPKITIITPSFNQGNYLEETILSVIGQGYQNLEYIIMDGGSTDNSLDIIHKYEKHFTHWECGTDKGQADAINRGFKISTGDIFSWLNSDDMLLPGSLNYVSSYLGNNHNPKIVFGNCQLSNIRTKFASTTDVVLSHKVLDITFVDYIQQPSCFWTKAVWDIVGPLNINLDYCLDWDWFIRAKILGVDFEVVSALLSLCRLHSSRKTAIGGIDRFIEIAGIYKAYHSEEIAHDYLKLRLDPTVKLVEKLMRRTRFPWRKRILRSLFLNNLTDKVYDQIILM
jgi:glycosyltransferase involved in cell wall biosynthesis